MSPETETQRSNAIRSENLNKIRIETSSFLKPEKTA